MTDRKTSPERTDRLKAAQTPDEKGYLSKVMSGEEQRRILRSAKKSEQTFTMADFWIMKGWYKNGPDGFRLVSAKWRYDTGAMKEATRFLIEKVLNIDPRQVKVEHFKKNKLSAVVDVNCHGYYNPYEAVKDAFPELNIKPWHMEKAPVGTWKIRENRIAAVRELVTKLGKHITDVTNEDFARSGMEHTILVDYYDGSPYKALKDAFPELNLKPEDMLRAPQHTWQDSEIRIRAFRELVEKLGKQITEITKMDMEDNGLSSLLQWYNGSIYFAIKEAYPESDIKPWHMARVPNNTWAAVENRAGALKELVTKLGVDPRELTTDDLYNAGYEAMLNHLHLYEIINEAYPDLFLSKPILRESTLPRGAWQNKEIRVASVRTAVAALSKDPCHVSYEDLIGAGVGGAVRYNNSSPYLTIKEAFPELDIYPDDMKNSYPGQWSEEKKRIKVIRDMVKASGKSPRDITSYDFIKNGIFTLLQHKKYYASVYAAINAAYPELKLKPWHMDMIPDGTFDDVENRKTATKELVEKLGKPLTSIIQEDFENNNILGVVKKVGGVYNALKEAYPNLKIWEMDMVPAYTFDLRENRVAAVRWLVQKLGKSPEDITREDIRDNGLRSLINHHGRNVNDVLAEAYPEVIKLRREEQIG